MRATHPGAALPTTNNGRALVMSLAVAVSFVLPTTCAVPASGHASA